jgi:transcriptional regulator with XRE-family HTH domain
MLLRSVRTSLGLTYAQMRAAAAVSEATLKRTASGGTVPKWGTVLAYISAVEKAYGGTMTAALRKEIQGAWRLARMEDRGTLNLRAPRPQYIADFRDLSKALEALYERAGAPPLRTVRADSEDPLGLPLSTLARIVSRKTLPVDERQLLAFVHGCGVPEAEYGPWREAWRKLRIPTDTDDAVRIPASILVSLATQGRAA